MSSRPSAHSEDTTIIKAALTYTEAGISVLPTGKDKIPRIKSWKSRESQIPGPEVVRKEFSKPGVCVALISGPVSGNLEVLDFDFGAEFFPRWKELVDKESPDLVDRLVRQRTQNGGKHIAYRCPNGKIPGSMKLAQRQNGTKPDTLIETRGQGAYFLAYPSKGYEIEQGRFSHPPDISPEERDTLINSAILLNQYAPKPPAPAKPPAPRTPGELSPGDDYDLRGDVPTLLTKHGWKRTELTTVINGDPAEHWTRPGKKSGISATLIDGKRLYMFSTNAAPFEPGQLYSPFAIYTALLHQGDFSAAAKDLSGQGYGSKAPRPKTQPKEMADRPVPVEKGETVVPGTPVTAYHLTDFGNAERLVDLHGKDLKFCHPFNKWLIWDGYRWTDDETGRLKRLCKSVIRGMYAEAPAEWMIRLAESSLAAMHSNASRTSESRPCCLWRKVKKEFRSYHVNLIQLPSC